MIRALGATMLAGRDFSEADRADGVPVVIVNQSMAAWLWPGKDAIGRRIHVGGPSDPRRFPWMTVIGVVGNMKRYALTETPRPEMMVPYTQNPYLTFGTMQFVVRSKSANVGADAVDSARDCRSRSHDSHRARSDDRRSRRDERIERTIRHPIHGGLRHGGLAAHDRRRLRSDRVQRAAAAAGVRRAPRARRGHPSRSCSWFSAKGSTSPPWGSRWACRSPWRQGSACGTSCSGCRRSIR